MGEGVEAIAEQIHNWYVDGIYLLTAPNMSTNMEQLPPD